MTSAAALQLTVGRRGIGQFVRRLRCLIRSTCWLLVFGIALLACQIALLGALLDGQIELGTYIAADVLGSAALAAVLVWRARRAGSGNRYFAALQIVAWSAVAGPFGTLVAMAVAFSSPLQLGMARDQGIVRMTAEHTEVEYCERVHIALLDHRMRIEGASLIHPLMDAIADGSQPAKLEALGVVWRKFETRLVGVLRRGLRDSDASVRVLAATVISKLHAVFVGKVGACQTAAAAHPLTALNWRNLAEARLAYAASGLLEGEQARAQIESAVGDLSRATELDPADQASADRLDAARRQLSSRRT
ncbi:MULTISPECIES: hypothetical protein [unclassified Bradyrhizobium]|uniref:hypothetical protein n=1 Tax=unclassified Bradyrhizobium TaxID=2631580 RepID=UPI0024787AFA|nr:MULTISPECIES: hypothetical protein [unclassified Bradyrhizobium]WGR68742.1 hypothetical protein MTX24_25335 [Bradyrhizobium sp. ISRA426]WGR80797.1 hypothetical protein MTX21_10450 [Bradyrhizobium sp. ISRA430]WGR83982.1 hypothetical protein MTX25_25015 [Bradyrhizobium sp. ISRA432]